jgi:hypothetical protein
MFNFNLYCFMKKLICYAVILCSATQLYAQGIIRGKVTDAGGRPLEFATVALFSAGDSVLAQGAITGAGGQFAIEKVPGGLYFITVSMIGFENRSSAVRVSGSQTVTVPDIALAEASHSLDEVTVVADRKFVEQQADKMVIDPGASVTTATDDALEVLRKSPGIIVDKDDNITLKNKTVRVMLDGRPSYMSGTELAAMLRNMQATAIDRIEIIENPSSRFDAEGDGGIINIRTKRGMMRGYNGSITLGASVGKYFSGNYGLDLNYRSEKWNVYGNYYGGQNEGFWDLDLTRRFMKTDSSMYKQYNLGEWTGNYNNVKLGIDYYITPKQVVGVMARGNIYGNDENDKNDAYVSSYYGERIQDVNTLQTDRSDGNNLQVNLNYKWTIDTLGQDLSVDADMASYYRKQLANMHTDYSPWQFPDIYRQDQRGAQNFYSVKADYVLPLNSKTRIEAGAKSSWATIDSDLKYEKQDEAGAWSDPRRMSNHFIYRENINAAYLSGNYKLNDQTSVQLGLRSEQTVSTGNNVTSDTVTKRDYINLFPSFFAQHKFNDSHQLGVSYSYRIGRPPYWALNPFVYMVDPYTYNQGNPNLNAQFTHTSKLSYTLKGKYIFSLDYSYTKDAWTQVFRQNDETRTSYITWENLNNYYNTNFTAVLPVEITKWFKTNTNLTVYYGQYTSTYQSGEIDQSQVTFRGNTSFTFTLPKDFTVELSGRYSSKAVYGMAYFYPQASIDGGIQKPLFKKKATLKLNFSDILNIQRNRYYSKYDNIDVEGLQHYDSRRANLTFTWRFGRNDIQAARQRRTGLEEETGRTGS